MFKYILNQWKKKKMTIILIVIGFIIANLFLSVGISMSVDSYNYIMDINSGNLKKQLSLEFEIKSQSDINKLNEVVNYIGEYGEVQLISLNQVQVENLPQVQVVPVCSKNVKGWHIPIIDGKYLDNRDNEVVIGKELAEKLHKNKDDKIKIGNKNYTIIGIVGRNERETNWDDVIYMNVDDYFADNLYENNGEMSLFYGILKTGKEEFCNDFDSIDKYAKKEGIGIFYKEAAEEVSNDSFSNSVMITVLSSMLIFVIALINIVNLMIYWMLERRQDFAIMKAMGATNLYIIKWIAVEMSLIAIIGATFAMLIQQLAKVVIPILLKGSSFCLDISVINIGFAFLVSLLCGIITAMLVSGNAIRFSPARVLASK